MKVHIGVREGLRKIKKGGMSQSSGKLITGGLGVRAGKSMCGEGTEVKRYRVSKGESHARGKPCSG